MNSDLLLFPNKGTCNYIKLPRGGPSVRFLTRYDGEVSEPLVGRQGSRVSMRVARASASLLSENGLLQWDDASLIPREEEKGGNLNHAFTDQRCPEILSLTG